VTFIALEDGVFAMALDYYFMNARRRFSVTFIFYKIVFGVRRKD